MLRFAFVVASVSVAIPAAAQPLNYGKGDWPDVSLEDTRGLRECTLEDPAPARGADLACRPPVIESPAHVSADLSWITGLALVDGGARGMHGLAADVAYWATRSLAIGVRYEMTGIGGAMMAGNDRAGTGFATLRYRAFTDEIDRDAFTVQLGGGFAMRSGELGREPVARLAVGREIGYMTGERAGVTWAWEVAGEQGLGPVKLASITAGVRAGFELGIREPKNIGERDPDPGFRYALGGEFRASPEIGLGASLDLPIPGVDPRRALWRTTALWTTDHDDTGEHGLRGTWGAISGPRINLVHGDFTPYIDVQGGPAAIFHAMDPDASLGVLAEAEFGLDVHLGDQTTLDLGGRIQAEVSDGLDVRTGFFILRVSHGPALR